MQPHHSKYTLIPVLLSGSACFPLLSLIVKGWVSGVLFFATVIALAMFIALGYKRMPSNMTSQPFFLGVDSFGRLTTLFLVAFILPFLSVALGQLLQGSFDISRFDGPSRYLMAIIVFLAVVRFKTAVPLLLEYTIPAATIITLVLIPFVPATFWSTIPHRLSNHFIDPLIFGQLSLALGVMSLMMIRPDERHPWYKTLFQLIGGVVGFYLSLRSGSRTGWFAIPLILFLWAFHYSPLNRWKTTFFAMIFTCLITLIIYSSSTTVRDRLHAMHSDIINYQWNTVNSETSVGDRINWIRIGLYFFSIHPLAGWGDNTISKNINDDAIAIYASEASRNGVLIAGFHNDYVANAVRYGIGGLVATMAIFFIPLLFFSYSLRYKEVKSFALAGIAYVLIQSVSSLTYHVLDFKFVSSFYALMISLLIGSIRNKVKN